MPQPSVYQVYQSLLKNHGEQHWWPGESAFEVMVGAVLTQNTSWVNVEKGIETLKQEDVLSAEALVSVSHDQLSAWLRPVGYFNVKAIRLKNFCCWYLASGEMQSLSNRDTMTLRMDLLSVNGIGPETADDILLYAFDRPVFVIDAYTRRLFLRLGFIEDNWPYEELRLWFEKKLTRVKNKLQVFKEYHALIVHHSKHFCKSKPACQRCCLNNYCTGKELQVLN